MIEDWNNDQNKEPLTEKMLIMYLSQMRNSLDIEMEKIKADKWSNNYTIAKREIDDFLGTGNLKILEDFYIRNGDLTKEPLTKEQCNEFIFQLENALCKEEEDLKAFCKGKMKKIIKIPKLEGNTAVMEAAIIFLAAESRFIKLLGGEVFTDPCITCVGMLLMHKDYETLCPEVLVAWEKYKDFWPIEDMKTLYNLLRYTCGDIMRKTPWASETYKNMSVATVEQILRAALVHQTGGLKPIPQHLVEHVLRLHKLTATETNL